MGVAGKLPLRDLGNRKLKNGDQQFHVYEVLREPITTPQVFKVERSESAVDR